MEKKDFKALSIMNSGDYQTMRKMISEIELKLMGVDPLIQKQFYTPIMSLIIEAWEDASNPEDTFLFPKPTSNGDPFSEG